MILPFNTRNVISSLELYHPTTLSSDQATIERRQTTSAMAPDRKARRAASSLAVVSVVLRAPTTASQRLYLPTLFAHDLRRSAH
jgi:hypothetical protein